MRVDQAGNQRAPAQIDLARGRRQARAQVGVGACVRDDPVLDAQRLDDPRRLVQRDDFAVGQEQDLGAGWSDGEPGETEKGDGACHARSLERARRPEKPTGRRPEGQAARQCVRREEGRRQKGQAAEALAVGTLAIVFRMREAIW